MQKLNRRVRVYVPGTMHGKLDPQAQEAWVEKALDRFADLFGGSTTIDRCRGAWKTNGKLIKEPIVLVYSFTDDAGLATQRQEVERFAQHMAVEMGQQCVSLEIDGELHFIEPQKEAA
jgi:hypothetical protein